MSQPFIFKKQSYSLAAAVLLLFIEILYRADTVIIQLTIFYIFMISIVTFAPIIREKLQYPLFLHTIVFMIPYLVPFLFIHPEKAISNNFYGIIFGIIIASVLLLTNYSYIRKQFSHSNYLLSFGIDKSEFYNTLISNSTSILLEELFFRYLMMGVLFQVFGVYSVFISAVLFTHSHYINRWANVKFNLRSYIYHFIIGILIGILFYYTKSLIGCLVSHFIFDLPTYIILWKRFRNANREVNYFGDY